MQRIRVCKVCFKNFESQVGLRHHQRTIHENFRWRCTTCDMVWKTTTSKRTHDLQFHPDGSHTPRDTTALPQMIEGSDSSKPVNIKTCIRTEVPLVCDFDNSSHRAIVSCNSITVVTDPGSNDLDAGTRGSSSRLSHVGRRKTSWHQECSEHSMHKAHPFPDAAASDGKSRGRSNAEHI